jgi:hypothetical protein
MGHGLCGSGASIHKTPVKTHSLLALTMIDPAIGWFEIAKANNKLAAAIQDLSHNTWLACCPQPQFIVFVNGGKVKREFKKMCNNYDIIAKPVYIKIFKSLFLCKK